MRISSSSKAVALLLLVSLQYSFAIVDVALCSKALCYPKVTGAKYGSVNKKCPPGFELGKDLSGKLVCAKKVAKPCPAGTSLKDGKCCGATGTSKQCVPMPGYTHFSCPAGFKPMKDCDSAGTPAVTITEKDGGRKLLTDNPLLKEVNIVATRVIPNLILPKPALSINMAPPKAKEQPKINLPSVSIPQIILPKPAVSINMPALPKTMPEVKFEGHPNFIPNIIPILPEPRITIDMQHDSLPKPFPTINANITSKVVTVDLSKVGPTHTAEVNLPAFPDLKHELLKLPDIDVKFPEVPKVIDLSGLGPKKSVNLTLPEVKLPEHPTITIKNDGANEPQFLDLTGFFANITGHGKDGKDAAQNYNIVLPKIKTEGATLNLVLDNHDNFKDVVLPGPGAKHNTVINVPGWDDKDMPSKSAKLTVDVSAAGMTDKLKQKIDQWNALAKDKEVENINIDMPDIDLSHIHPAGPNVVVDVKPFIKFNKSISGAELKTLDQFKSGSGKAGPDVRVNVTMKDIEIPKLAKDATIVIKPKQFDMTKILPKSLLDQTDDGSAPTTTTINLPVHSLPSLPVPKGKTDIDVTVPVKIGGLLKHLNASAQPDVSVNVKYEEEWTGGNQTIPNPGSKVANFIGKAVNAVTTAACPTKCCQEIALNGCMDQEFEVETVPVQFECEAGCAYDLKNDKCLCSPGTAADCPAGLTKCSIAGKGVCAPDVEGHFGMEACGAFKAVCSKVGVLAKTCL